MLHKRQASAAFLIYKSVTAQRCHVSCPKPKASQQWAGIPTQPFIVALAAPLYLRLALGGCHPWFWGISKTLGGIMKMVWEWKPRKLGAENPVILWLKEVTDVQCVKGWHFLSWILSSAFLFSFLSIWWLKAEAAGDCEWFWGMGLFQKFYCIEEMK